MRPAPGRRRWIAMVSAASELGAHMVAHCPADHLAGQQIEDHGQVEPALASCDVGNVGQPDLIGPVGDKVLIQQVWRHRQGMLSVGRAHAIAAWRSSPEAMLAHHPFDPFAADGRPSARN